MKGHFASLYNAALLIALLRINSLTDPSQMCVVWLFRNARTYIPTHK